MKKSHIFGKSRVLKQDCRSVVPETWSLPLHNNVQWKMHLYFYNKFSIAFEPLFSLAFWVNLWNIFDMCVCALIRFQSLIDLCISISRFRNVWKCLLIWSAATLLIVCTLERCWPLSKNILEIEKHWKRSDDVGHALLQVN